MSGFVEATDSSFAEVKLSAVDSDPCELEQPSLASDEGLINAAGAVGKIP
jgi:hypothetical protein